MKMGRAAHDKKGKMNMAEMRSVEERLAELDQKMEQIKSAEKGNLTRKEKAQQKQAADQAIVCCWSSGRICPGETN